MIGPDDPVVGGLGDVQDMALLSDSRNIDAARLAFIGALAAAKTHQQVIVLYRLARDWEAGMMHLTDLAAAKLERV